MTTSYTYDSANRMTSAGGIPYTWDANGNLLSDGTYTYSYDHANRLKAVSGLPSAVSYKYNGMGDRIEQTVGATTTRYTLDLNAGLTQVLSDGTDTYLYGVGRIAQQQGSQKEYFLTDALGSVRQLADNTSITLNESYQPYGELLSNEGSSSSIYGFTGEIMDSYIESIYLRSRYYSPATGRFYTKDTWQGDYTRPASYNAWLYVYANPINLTDPSGYDIDFPIDIRILVNGRDLTIWLFNELYANAHSEYVTRIHDLLSRSLGTDYRPYIAFTYLVKDKAKWDFKYKIKEYLRSESIVLFDGGLIQSGTYRWYEYSVPGNIQFGYVGRAAGFPGELLHLGAGEAEIRDPSHVERNESCCLCDKRIPFCRKLCFYINFNWTRSWFDDPQDYAAVEAGIRMYDMYGPALTMDGFQNILRLYGPWMAPTKEHLNWEFKSEFVKWPYRVGDFNGPDEYINEPVIRSLLFSGN